MDWINACTRMLNWAVRHRAIVLVDVWLFRSQFAVCQSGGYRVFLHKTMRIAVKLELPVGARKEINRKL